MVTALRQRMALMHLRKVLDPAARDHRVRYAIAAMLRDRLVNEGALTKCLEVEDANEVIQIILRRGLKNAELRVALLDSHLMNFHQWLVPHPEFAEAYYANEVEVPRRKSLRWRKRSE